MNKIMRIIFNGGFRQNKIAQDNRGSILMITILILSGIMIVVLGASGLIFSGLKMSGTQENSTIAYYIAEAGIEKFLFTKKNNSSLTCGDGEHVDFSTNGCDPSVKNEIFNNGTYTVQFKASDQIISIGEYKGVKRIVEVDL